MDMAEQDDSRRLRHTEQLAATLSHGRVFLVLHTGCKRYALSCAGMGSSISGRRHLRNGWNRKFTSWLSPHVAMIAASLVGKKAPQCNIATKAALSAAC